MAVIIPYALNVFHALSGNGDELPIAASRAFNRFLSVIKAVAVFHQKQRSVVIAILFSIFPGNSVFFFPQMPWPLQSGLLSRKESQSIGPHRQQQIACPY